MSSATADQFDAHVSQIDNPEPQVNNIMALIPDDRSYQNQMDENNIDKNDDSLILEEPRRY